MYPPPHMTHVSSSSYDTGRHTDSHPHNQHSFAQHRQATGAQNDVALAGTYMSKEPYNHVKRALCQNDVALAGK